MLEVGYGTKESPELSFPDFLDYLILLGNDGFI